ALPAVGSAEGPHARILARPRSQPPNWGRSFVPCWGFPFVRRQVAEASWSDVRPARLDAQDGCMGMGMGMDKTDPMERVGSVRLLL
ncbi:hypothetical protein, partial [Streptomyces lavendulae]|uniref:hypothetical protein n=1 Tax=Streptomyces lavendulae TaxID=1914 RepID=UPI0025559417